MGTAYATDLTTSSTSLSGYDINPPLVTRVDAKQTSYEGSHTVEAEFIDAESEIDSESDSVTVPNVMVTGCQKTNRKISCTASGMKAGEHTIHVSVKDKYGNKKEEDHHVTITDTVAPIIDSIAASPANVTVKYHDPAPSSGIKSILVTVDGIKLDCCSVDSNRNHDWDNCDAGSDDHTNGLGPYLGWGHCHHGNGNGYGHDRDSDSFEHLATGCSSIAGTTSCDGDDFDDLGDHDGDGNLSDDNDDSSDNDDDYEREHSSGSVGLTCPILQTLSCGPHEVVVTITDNAGNTTTGTAVLNSGGDCTAPVTTDNAPTGWQNTDVNVTLTCTDAGSGCASTTYEVDGGTTQTGNTVSLTTNGTHTITYRSTDVAGNVEVTRTATVMIDKTPPDVTTSGNMTAEATGPSGASASFTASATDALSGVVGDTTCTPASGSTFPLGTTTVTCSATDAAGNTGSATLNVIVVDTTPPVVTTSGDMTVEATGPSGAVADFTSGATDIVDGTDLTSCTPASGSTFPLGTTTVTCSATDAAGNTGSATLTVKVQDTTAPAVTYTGPSDTIYTSESPTITGTATDAVGVVSATASIGGGPEIACTVDAGNVSCPTSGVDYGPHTVVITATDAAGNAGTATGTFCKSSGRPNLMLYKVKGPYVVSGDPYRWVTVDYRMANSGPSAYNVSMLSMTANNGIYLTSPSPLPVLGNISPGESVSFSVKYYWPVGVSSYIFTNTACAEDQCFTEYMYP
jgi:hypothetical protein